MKTKPRRFSKQYMIGMLEAKLSAFEKHYHFRRDLGTAQVHGADFEVIMAYGEYEACQSILEDLQD